MKKLIPLLGLLASLSASAEWVYVTSNAEKDKTFFNPKTIGVYENYRKAWVLVNFAKPQPVETLSASSKSTYYKFDCAGSRFAVIAELTTSELGGEGKILKKVSASEDVWTTAMNNDPLKPAMEAVCSK